MSFWRKIVRFTCSLTGLATSVLTPNLDLSANLTSHYFINQGYQRFNRSDESLNTRSQELSQIQYLESYRNGLASGLITSAVENLQRGQGITSDFQADAQTFFSFFRSWS